MKTYTYIIEGLYPLELTMLKKSLRYFKENTPVKITYRFKKIYIHIREDQKYSVLLNMIESYITTTQLQQAPRIKVTTTKQGYKFLSDYFGYNLQPQTNKK